MLMHRASTAFIPTHNPSLQYTPASMNMPLPH